MEEPKPIVPGETLFKVNSNGFVSLVDIMGDDAAICQAARISHKNETSGADVNLIRNLMRWGHWSPFEMCEIKMRVRAPIYVWRQWIRHRTASVNEASLRYTSTSLFEVEHTATEEWRYEPGREEKADLDRCDLCLAETCSNSNALDTYEKMLEVGIVKEQARKVLPLATYTEAYWKIDLRNLLNFLKLRLASGAQQAIRDYAEVIYNKIVMPNFPMTWQAFNDYVLNAETFSADELDILMRKAEGGDVVGWSIPGREGDDFIAKVEKHSQRCAEQLRRSRLD